MWASGILALIKFVSALIAYAQQRKLISTGEAIASLEIMKAQHDALVRANTIRESVHSDLVRNPDSILQDDGFKRKD